MTLLHALALPYDQLRGRAAKFRMGSWSRNSNSGLLCAAWGHWSARVWKTL